MRFVPVTVSDWPPLAWVSKMTMGQQEIYVNHGPMVEVRDGWIAEAVWAGEFMDGNFDTTELIFGTGIRIRKGKAVFVSAGSMMDRLWQCRNGKDCFVGNSLPALLACSGMSLDESYMDYPADMLTQMNGLNLYKKKLVTHHSDLCLTYYKNLIYDGRNLIETDKPTTVPDFQTFEDYDAFLGETAIRLRSNFESSHRRYNITPLATLSKGYDSCAAAVIARRAGAKKAVTIKNASTLLPKKDSGKDVADYLGLSCQEYYHSPVHYRQEDTIWAATGDPASLNFTIFEYPKPLCIMFTGYRGDSVWQRERLDRSQPFKARAMDGLGLSEFRLHKGIFHCPVPFWGSLKVRQIEAISFSSQMAPWSLGGKYDRPIPRRIVEEAGVPRDQFGFKKKATFAPRSYFWPFTENSMKSFHVYLRQRHFWAPSCSLVWILRKLSHIDQLLTVNFNHFFGTKFKGFRPYLSQEGQKLLFQWANHKLKSKYARSLYNQIKSVQG